jgi:hypothetical protein
MDSQSPRRHTTRRQPHLEAAGGSHIVKFKLVRPSNPLRSAAVIRPVGPVGRVTPRPSASPHSALDAVEQVSRRIDDLARQLNCLGHFDVEDDRPRAA